MARNPKDEEWAFTGRESLFQRKLASVRGDQTSDSLYKSVPSQQQPARGVDPASLLRDTLQNLQNARPEEIEAQALLDAQTGFLNCRQFMQRLDYELKRGNRFKRPVAICIVSVDGTREVKRMYGAEAGDRLVKLAAGAIAGTIREVDLPARYSADLLVVIFPETNANGVKVVAERIRQKVRNQVIELGSESMYITATIGCASFPAHGRESSELIAKSLLAVEDGSQQGGDAVYFS